MKIEIEFTDCESKTLLEIKEQYKIETLQETIKGMISDWLHDYSVDKQANIIFNLGSKD